MSDYKDNYRRSKKISKKVEEVNIGFLVAQFHVTKKLLQRQLQIFTVFLDYAYNLEKNCV